MRSAPCMLCHNAGRQGELPGQMEDVPPDVGHVSDAGGPPATATTAAAAASCAHRWAQGGLRMQGVAWAWQASAADKMGGQILCQ